MSTSTPALICLMGPTASGKTDLAIHLAANLECELVSVDSALVYRGLDIGSAKPEYPHHLVDIREPHDVYSAADFVKDCHRICAEISSRGNTPLLVGGTMLYFKAFLEGIDNMPAADPAIRQEINNLAHSEGWPAVHAALAEVDPEAAGRIHPNHSQRLCRALEVYRVSGITLSEWHRGGHGVVSQPAGEIYRVAQLAICPQSRAELHCRIAQRFQQMMSSGFVSEVEGLMSDPRLHPELPSMRSVGYRQLWQHLAGECSLEQAVEEGIIATRQLAKRQLTWLRKWSDLAWICTDRDGKVVEFSGAESILPIPGENSPAELALKYLQLAIP